MRARPAERPGERLADAAYAGGWALVRWLPGPVARAAFWLVAEAAWRRGGRGVRQLRANLRRVTGASLSDRELRALCRAAVQSYCRYWLEVFRLPVLGGDLLASRFQLRDGELLWTALRSGRGVILALPHSGNWDHAGAWLVHRGYPFTTVAERLRPESLYARFVAFRERLGMEVLSLTGGDGDVYRTLAARLRANGVACLLADRDLTPTGVEVTFFGEPARMPAGPAALALDTGAALLPVTLWYEGRAWAGRIHPEVTAPRHGTRQERIAAMTQRMADEFEDSIRAHPRDWHMLQRLWTADLDGGTSQPPPGEARDPSGRVRGRRR